MSTVEIAWGILACLQQLTGDRASGTATVTATEPTAVVPANSFGVPILTSDAGERYTDWDHPIRTVVDTTVTPAGVAVGIVANKGGRRLNLPPNTPIRWFPEIPGVGGTLVNSMTGGEEPEADHAFLSLVFSQEIPPSGPIAAAEMIRGGASRVPAGFLSWLGGPPDGEKGLRQSEIIDRWSLVIVVDKSESHAARARQGLTILNLAHGLLLDRKGVTVAVNTTPHTMVVSSPGIEILGRKPRTTEPGFYAYELTFATRNGMRGLDNPSGMFAQWLRTKYDFPTLASETGAHPSTLAVAGPATYPHPSE